MLKSLAFISVSEARKLQENWIKTRAADIERARGKQDVHEFLFSVDELQKYLNYIKENSASKTPGVRVYLAAYNEKDNDNATIFLSPTLDVTSDVANDYDLQPLNRGMSGWPPRNY